jgi:hypothetical protein
MSLTASLAAVKATLETGKIVRDLVQRPKIDAQAVEANLHEMLIHLNNVYLSLAEARVEMQELRAAADTRASQKALDEDMDFQIDGGFYVRKSEVEKGLIPYCPVCWKKDGNTVPLESSATAGWFRCSIHESVYKTAACRDYEKNRRSSAQRQPRSGGPRPRMS